MTRSTTKPLYRHQGVGLLRAAALAHADVPGAWPDPTDTESCRGWLDAVWQRPELVEAIRLATPGLGARVDQITAGTTPLDRQVRRAALSVVRYMLRAAGRHTPFGMFAGAAPVSIQTGAKVRWGGAHRAIVAADTQWLAAVIEQLEASSELLERLDVVATDLVVRRGERFEVPNGQGRATIRWTRPAQLALKTAATPVGFAVLVARVTETFPATDATTVRRYLATLVRQGFLITSLRAPVTVTDLLAYLCDRLDEASAHELPDVSAVARRLGDIRSFIDCHNDQRMSDAADPEQLATDVRTILVARMRRLSDAGRVPLATTLRLDCEVRLPETVAQELERAATALMRLTRQPTGEAAWRDYYTAFCDRYGMDALVPVADVVDPDAGIGLPATYPGSMFTGPAATTMSARDERLLAIAWQAMSNQANQLAGTDEVAEVVLTDELIATIELDDLDGHAVPPHVEIAARIDAADCAALERGEFTVTVRPARAVGTLTSRFAGLVPEAGLDEIFGRVPVATEGGLPVQLSFPPMYPHAENICRVPAYLPDVLSLGELRGHEDRASGLDDLAVLATRGGLHLVSLSRGQVVEPQAFHALALDKQPPPVARFLAHLSRGNDALWHAFDWGPAARGLSFLPRVRHGRAVLSPARWRLTKADLRPTTDLAEWTAALGRWRDRWHCPAHVELVDADRALPLDLTVPAHAAIAQAHLSEHEELTFTEVADSERLGWIDGHAHNVVLPLFTTRPPAPSPLQAARPVLTNANHGQTPGAPGTEWLFVKLFTHPERMDCLLTRHLPRLIGRLAETAGHRPDCWFARYRSRQEADHLRLRLRVRSEEDYQTGVAAIGHWGQQLRSDGLAGRMVIDTYYPETGRYSTGRPGRPDSAMRAAERVFVADSRVVASQLGRLNAGAAPTNALVALNMFATTEAFLGSREAAAAWWKHRPSDATTDRAATAYVIDLVRQHSSLLAAAEHLGVDAAAWQERAAALADYRRELVPRPDSGLDSVLESLLHMHHNRAHGIDRASEATCHRITRQIAFAWLERQDGHSR